MLIACCFQGASLDAGQLSDTTASAPGSDDEVGSTAATDGSTLRTSPAEHGGSAGSESGGSNVESVSGRSSAYGDLTTEPAPNPSSRSEPSTFDPSLRPAEQDPSHPEEPADPDGSARLHQVRLMLLERLTRYIPELREVGGVRAIPFMQVILMLTADVDSEEDRDKSVLDALLTTLLSELNMIQPGGGPVTFNPASLSCRTLNHEMRLIVMRLLSVLMSRTKAGTKPAAEVRIDI